MKKNSTTKQPLEDSKNAKPVLRDSGYRDYVAVDMVDERGLIVSTPFYIKEGQTIEAHWPKPSNEQPKNPIHYDDFNDVFQFMMQDGNILSKWANSGLNSVFEIMDKKDLETLDFHKARKIKVIESKPDSKEGLHTQGEWKVENYSGEANKGFETPVTVVESGRKVCCIGFIWGDTREQSIANAELIVKAVNERDGLLKKLNDEETTRISAEVALEIIEKERNELRNERKALLDSHGELKTAAHNALMTLQALRDIDKSIAPQTIKELETAINNAKNIKQ